MTFNPIFKFLSVLTVRFAIQVGSFFIDIDLRDKSDKEELKNIELWTAQTNVITKRILFIW